MAIHPISATGYSRLPESPDDETVLRAFRLAYVEVQAKLQEKLDNHPGRRGPLGVNLAVVLGQDVECTNGDCRRTGIIA